MTTPFDHTVNIDLKYKKIVNIINSDNFDVDDNDNKEILKHIRICFLKNKAYDYDKEILTMIKIKQQQKLLAKYNDKFIEASLLFNTGDRTKAKDIFKDIVKNICDSASFKDSDDTYKLMFKLACLYYEDKEYRDSALLFISIFKYSKEKSEFSEFSEMKILCDAMGYYFLKNNDIELVYSLFEITFYYKFKIRNDVKKDLYILNRIGDIYLLSKIYSKAKVYYLKMEDMMKKYPSIYDNKNKIKLQILYNLGSIYLIENNFEYAKEILLESYKSRKNVFGNNHDDTLKSLFKLASSEAKLGEFEISVKRLKYLSHIFKEKYGGEYLYYIDTQYVLGEIYIEQNNFEDAKTIFKNIKNVYKNNYEYSNFNIFKTIDKLALLYFKQKQYDLAIQEWIQIIQNLKTPDDFEAVLFKYDVYYNFGLTLYKLGKIKSCEDITNYIYHFSFITFGPTNKNTLLTANLLQSLNLKRYDNYCKTMNNKKTDSIKKFYVKLNIDYFFGLSFYYNNQYDAAINYFEVLLELYDNPDNYGEYNDGTDACDIQSGNLQILFCGKEEDKDNDFHKALPLLSEMIAMPNSRNLIKEVIKNNNGSIVGCQYENIESQNFKNGLNHSISSNIDISQNIIYNLSCAFYRLGKFDKAEEMLIQLIEKCKQNFKTPINTILYLYEHLVIIYRKQNKILLVKKYLNYLLDYYEIFSGNKSENYLNIIDLLKCI
jgi:hypothetical protein